MKKIIILTWILASFCLTSCSEDLEGINQNPNNPEFVLPNTIFNSATKEYTDVTRDEDNAARLTLPWMQYWGQIAYADEDRYLYRETSAQNLYENSYKIALDFKTIIDINTDEETAEIAATVGNNNNQIATSRIMLAYIFHKLTDFFGDVPYYSYGNDDPDFEALDIDNILSPVFASSDKIYADLLKELREASDMINTDAIVFTSGDNIFNGDAIKWKKFENSLILRIANRLRNVDPTTANAAIDEAIAAGVFTSNEDNAAQPYGTANATSSPIWIAYINRTDFAVSAPFIELLNGTRGDFGLDPRLFEIAAPISVSIDNIKNDSYDRSENDLDYIGVPYAFRQANLLPFTSYSFPSSKIIRPDYSEVYMEYAEVAFILSEHNNWNQAEYENGVRASMQKWGVEETAIDSFISDLPVASQEKVLNQKYIALYMQPHEAWSEYRRTGFPNTLTKPGAFTTLPENQAGPSGVTSYKFEAGNDLTDLPTRLRYPIILQTLNGTNRAAAVEKLDDGDLLTSKLFWDVN